MTGDKVYILGTGAQAPYGIGEIIAIIPRGHIKKIQDICSDYYKSPALRLNSANGKRLIWDYDHNDRVSGLIEGDEY